MEEMKDWEIQQELEDPQSDLNYYLDAQMRKEPSITCPDCGMTSYNSNDIREGYCGNCHAYTRRT